MDKRQVMDVLEKIQAYRQSFLITNKLIDEWYRVLEPYDYYDVNKKLDDYFRDGENFGKYPDVYYITRYLKTIEEKQIVNEPHAICQICRQPVKYENYQKHSDRCSSIEYIVEMSKRYLEKNVSKEKLLQADDKAFEKFYYSTCKLIYNKMPDGFPKHLLENVLLTYEGETPKYNLETIMEGVGF